MRESQPNQQQFYNQLERMNLYDKFITARLNLNMANDWKYPDSWTVFSRIELEGLERTLYYVTDSMKSELDRKTVFGMWKNEQYVTHIFSEGAVKETMEKFAIDRDEQWKVLDVGAGGGISALIMQAGISQIGITNIETIGIDQNDRAIDFCKYNEKLNNLQGIKWQNEVYNINSAPISRSAIIQLAPPYNPRPELLGQYSTMFSDGLSEDATQNFQNQLSIAYRHLAPNGIIVVNQMTPSFNNLPGALEIIRKLDPGLSVDYIEIFDPMSSKDFLNTSFGFDVDNKDARGQINNFKQRLTEAHNNFHYNVLIIKNDGLGLITCEEHDLSFGGFESRAEAHKGINVGAMNQLRKSIL